MCAHSLCVCTGVISFLGGHFSVSVRNTLNSSYDIGYFNEVNNYVINADCVKPWGCIFCSWFVGPVLIWLMAVSFLCSDAVSHNSADRRYCTLARDLEHSSSPLQNYSFQCKTHRVMLWEFVGIFFFGS